MLNILFNFGHISRTINSINSCISANERSQSNIFLFYKVELPLKATECELKVNYTVHVAKAWYVRSKGP